MPDFLSVSIGVLQAPGNPYTLNWIGNIIKVLLESAGNMGLGIILFTLILKLLTLPLDIFSRASMKKNNLKMEKMRPQLEKLQRQYANTPEIYNQKMQALYKKEGYSMLSSCLPTLVTLIIFIIVINQFTNYSNYNNLMVLDGMVGAYNTAVFECDESLIHKVTDVDGTVKEIFLNEQNVFSDSFFDTAKNAGIQIINSTENAYSAEYKTNDANKLAQYYQSLKTDGYANDKLEQAFVADEFGVYSFNKNFYQEAIEDDELNKLITTEVMKLACNKFVDENVRGVGRQAAADYYHENIPSFLWVKNIWECDLPWKHPVKQSFSEYKFMIRKGCSASVAPVEITDADYMEITAYLEDEKNSANGYLILVILSIGVMLLSQFITNKTQKAQLELQSVDGQAAQTSKMMMWMMPIMFGFFAFVYTASFSIYMVVSSVLSTGTMLIINYFVEKAFNKKAEQEAFENDKRNFVNKSSNTKNNKNSKK